MKITRKRALEIAQEAIQEVMPNYVRDAQLAAEGLPHITRRAERYAEFAAALAWLEQQARQKEMHL